MHVMVAVERVVGRQQPPDAVPFQRRDCTQMCNQGSGRTSTARQPSMVGSTIGIITTRRRFERCENNNE